MAARWYNTGIQKILNGVVGNLESVNLDWLLLTSGYSFNDEHDFVTDLTPGSNELTGGNYARIDIASPAVTVDDTSDGAYFDATDPSFTSLAVAAGTPAWLVLFKNVGSDATNILLCALALPGTAPDGNNYVCQLQAPPAGIGYWRNVAGLGIVYNNGLVDILKNLVDLLTDTIECSLHTSAYTVNPDHDVLTDLTNELSGGNYARVNLGGKSITPDDTNNGAYLDATDPSFTSLQAAAGSPTQMVLRCTTPDRLVAAIQLTTPATPNGNNYVINLAAPPAAALWIRNSAS